MSTAAQSSELDALPPRASEPARKTRGVFVSFAGMVLVGLALAGWYVSQRIMAAEPQPPSAVPQSVSTTSGIPQIATHQAAPLESQVLLPLALEYYLQIAALGTPEDAVYLKQLQAKGFHAQFEAAEAAHEAQILIGPYADRDALRRARNQLISAGILAVELIR